jgi:hypothetical protein
VSRRPRLAASFDGEPFVAPARDSIGRVPDSRTSTSLSLTTGGITLLGVLLSVGVSVGFGVEGEWWARVLAGAGTTLALVIVVKLGTASGRGPLARIANWIIGSPDDRRDA